MSKIPFDEKEMTIAYTVPNMLDPTIPESPAWTYPQSEKEAIKELYAGTHPCYLARCMPEHPPGVPPVWSLVFLPLP